mgnify:CR=1 FL=1
MAYDFANDDITFYDADFFGDDAVFQALTGGTPVDVVVIVDKIQDSVPDGYGMQVFEVVTTINAPYSVVGLPVRGDTFTVGAVIYTVEGVLSSNRLDVKCSVVASVAPAAYVPPAATGYDFSQFQNSQYLGTF